MEISDKLPNDAFTVHVQKLIEAETEEPYYFVTLKYNDKEVRSFTLTTLQNITALAEQLSKRLEN